MRIGQQSLLDLLGEKNIRFVIPIYQRAYSWTQRQCEELWRDILRAAKVDGRHFVGTVLYTPEDDDEQGHHRFAIIDGQQRLTTLTLLLAALGEYLGTHDGAVPELTSATLTGRYLLADDDASACKLALSPKDDDTLQAVIVGTPMPAKTSARVTENLSFFQSQMTADDFDAQTLWRGLKGLFAITAQVDDADQAQSIFEGLNSKGYPLTITDLVRNYLLLTESHDEQERLYREYWEPMEGLFVPDPGSLRLDNAIKGWLSVRFPRTRMKSTETVYSGFKQYVEDEYDGTKEDLLHELRGFCLVWAENYRYHAVKKFKSSYDWARNGAPTLTSNYPLKPASNPEYAERVRKELKSVDANM